jgi:hypothetical protein
MRGYGVQTIIVNLRACSDTNKICPSNIQLSSCVCVSDTVYSWAEVLIAGNEHVYKMSIQYYFLLGFSLFLYKTWMYTKYPHPPTHPTSKSLIVYECDILKHTFWLAFAQIFISKWIFACDFYFYRAYSDTTKHESLVYAFVWHLAYNFPVAEKVLQYK